MTTKKSAPVKKKTAGTFFITTPIYYLNDVAHIGHAYTTIVADTLARWHRLKGEEVTFLTGTDENSVKTKQGAKKYGEADIKKYADFMAASWIETWKVMKISNTDFIRTTEPRHAKAVTKFFESVYKKGDIYKGSYSGLYCEGCEAFLTENELKGGLCPHHKTKPIVLKEENYFFSLSKYQKRLLDYIEANPEFILPLTRRNEVVSFIKEGLKDISISRPGVGWGISLPIDKDHVFWVWFDALLNYISADESMWPADVHMMAKDIVRFHAIIWPAMLMSAGYPLPKRVFAHGFFTVNGEKISKSLGNAINPLELMANYPLDAIRYFLMREIPLGEDGDFSERALAERINGELVSDIGNLTSRVLTLAEKHGGPYVGNDELSGKLNFKQIEKYVDSFELHHAIMKIWEFIRECNKYINDREPWKLEGEELSAVLYNLLEALRVISILVSPFMPETAEEINRQLGVEAGNFDDLGFREFSGNPKKGKHLFQRIKG